MVAHGRKMRTRLSTYLRRIAPALRAVGINVKEHKRTGRGQPIEITPIPGDVAGGSPLFKSWEERSEGVHQPAGTGGVNRSGNSATSATPNTENGGNAGISAALGGVAGVAECSSAEAQLHRNSANSGNEISRDGVAGAAVTGSSPTSVSARRRIVL